MKKIAAFIVSLAIFFAAPSAFAQQRYQSEIEDDTLRSRTLDLKPPQIRHRPTLHGARGPTGLPEGELPYAARATVDLVLFRPIGLLSLVAGTGLYVLWLPFTVPTGSMVEASKGLVMDPFRFTFVRPVGELKSDTRGVVPTFKRRRFGPRRVD